MSTSASSAVKAYRLPLLLFTASLVFQIIIIPSSFPPSHYDVIGVRRDSSIEEVTRGYNQHLSSWYSGRTIPTACDFVKIRYAFEILSNTVWKRNYDIFGIEEQLHALESLKIECAGKHYLDINTPFLEASFSDHDLTPLTPTDLRELVESGRSSLVQVFSVQSRSSVQFVESWKQIVSALNGIANSGLVELGNVDLASTLAEKKLTGRPFFPKGIPSLVAYPPGCKNSHCVVRYEGELLVDAVTDWFASTVLSLPHIPYYSKEALVPNFLARSSPLKVKVILFSKNGERATPYLRSISRSYHDYASFSLVRWQQQDSLVWSNSLGVQSAPCIVVLKDPGLIPTLHHGLVNQSFFSDFIERNKFHELPALTKVTSAELGCDARGFSRGGAGVEVWYCVVLAGRRGPVLNKMREAMRRVQDPTHRDSSAVNLKRLTLVWLDGEDFCLAFVGLDHGLHACGPRKDPDDAPRLFILRYQRKAPQVGPASVLVANYKGAAIEDSREVTGWISKVVEDGDTVDIPFFSSRVPELVPDDGAAGMGRRISMGEVRRRGRRVLGFIYYELSGDPRIGPFLLLASLLSFSHVWFRRLSAVPRAVGANVGLFLHPSVLGFVP